MVQGKTRRGKKLLRPYLKKEAEARFQLLTLGRLR
jgi:hypothetical protein